MSQCPICKSDYIFYSKKKSIYICEDCGEMFDTPFTETKELQLFFSYGHDDNSVIVEKLKEELEKRGHYVWIDKREIRSGDDWREKITKGILNSDKVVSFMSCHSVRNPGVCLDELKIALCVRNADIRTVLLEGEDVVKPPSSLSCRQWLDMSEWQTKMNEGEDCWQEWFNEKLEILTNSIESEESYAFVGEIEKLRASLKPVLYDSRELNLVERRFEGRQWLMDKVLDWKNNPVSKKIFCIYGVPGAGKSSFLANLMHYNPEVLGTVFFEWNETQRNSIREVISSLAFQIASKLPDYRQQLLHKISSEDNVEKYNESELFRVLLTDPLNNCIDGNRTTYMIALDALDEVSLEKKDMLALLLDCLEKLPAWIKIIVTAREETAVKALLTDAEQVTLDGEHSENKNDIKEYVSKRLREVPWVDYRVIQNLADKSEGSFLYAVFCCDSILSGDIGMDDMTTMPKGLGRFYMQNFFRIFKDGEYEVFRPILELLNCGESIPREILCEILHMDQYKYNEFRKKLGSFVQVNRVNYPYTSEPQFFVKFVHKSLAEWLADFEKAEKFGLDIKHGKRALAEYALEQVRKQKRYVSKPTRYIAQECPQISIDLDLDYLQVNLGKFLIDAGMYKEYEEFLLEEDTTWIPYWHHVGQYPQDYPIDRLLERLQKGFDAVWEKIKYSHYQATHLFVDQFLIMENIVKNVRGAEVLFKQLTPGRLDNFFRSAASDEYRSRGLPGIFNADKVDVAYYIWKCIKRCEENHIPIPEAVKESVERIKLSCLFYEGKYDDSLETICQNYSFFFKDNICILDDEKISNEFNFKNVKEIRGEFNTFCLEEYLKGFVKKDDVVDALVAQGADINKAAERAIKYHEERSKKFSEPFYVDIAENKKIGLRVNTTMSSSNSQINYIEYLKNRYAAKKRWHPWAATYVMGWGAQLDYCKIYKFGCCGRNVISGEPPSQYRPDGCEEWPGEENESD